jgi:hypothetical protein
MSCNSQEIVIAKWSCHCCYRWPCMVRIHNQPPLTSLHAEQWSRENISDPVDGGEDLSVWHRMAWHDINSLESMRFQTNASIDFRLWIMCFSRSGSHRHLVVISFHRLICRQVEPNQDSLKVKMFPHLIFDAGWTTRDREVGSTTRLDLPSDCRRACAEPSEDVWCLAVKCRESTSRRDRVRFGRHILRAVCHLPSTVQK